MALSDIAKLLIELADQGGPFGSEGERSLRTLAEALLQRPDADVHELAKLLKPKAPRKPKMAPIESSAVVDEYVNDFGRSLSAGAAEGVLARMMSDKNVKKDETIAIARAVTGMRAFKSKAAAQDGIRERIKREAWDAGALDIIKSRVNR
jgi:hypothetical protein